MSSRPWWMPTIRVLGWDAIGCLIWFLTILGLILVVCAIAKVDLRPQPASAPISRR